LHYDSPGAAQIINFANYFDHLLVMPLLFYPERDLVLVDKISCDKFISADASKAQSTSSEPGMLMRLVGHTAKAEKYSQAEATKSKVCLNFLSSNFKVQAVIAVQKHKFFRQMSTGG